MREERFDEPIVSSGRHGRRFDFQISASSLYLPLQIDELIQCKAPTRRIDIFEAVREMQFPNSLWPA